MHVIRHQAPFRHFRFFVLRQLPEHLSKMPTQHAEYPFLALLRDEHHRVFTIPPRMREALVLFHP